MSSPRTRSTVSRKAERTSDVREMLERAAAFGRAGDATAAVAEAKRAESVARESVGDVDLEREAAVEVARFERELDAFRAESASRGEHHAEAELSADHVEPSDYE